jgi:hypothetical protein
MGIGMAWQVLTFAIPISIASVLVGAILFFLGVVGLSWAVKKFLVGIISGIRLGLRRGKE